MAGSALRIIVDGDSDKVYRNGDEVTGKVILLAEEDRQIASLKLVFAGSSVTKTTRPRHAGGNTNNNSGRHEYEKNIRLFNRERELVHHIALGPKKHSWTFTFTFPELTEHRCERSTHGGANYLREPHTLPPSLELTTNAPGGAAQIHYFVQARLTFGGAKEIKRCKHLLRYHPRPHVSLPREPNIISTVLHGQQWKPKKEKDASRIAVANLLSRRLSSKSPRIVPCFSHPEAVAPGQHIPLSLCLKNTRDPANERQEGCTLDALSVTISTFSRVMCGHDLTQPEDVVAKHVTCITRTAMNKPLPFNETQLLTSNFCLINDNECVPTFKTYAVTRRYALNVSIRIKHGSQHFTIRSSTPLEILPRIPQEIPPPLLEDMDEPEPLPLYEPREPSREFAPDYELIHALSPTASRSSSNALSLPGSRSSSLFSGGSGPGTTASTPVSEIEQPNFESGMMRVS